MIFTLKDLIYVISILVVFISTWEAMKYKLKKIEDSNATIKRIVFQEKGGLNIIDNPTCKEHRKQIKTDISVVKLDIKREAETTQRAFDEIQCLNQNIIKIMMHMKLEPVVYRRRKQNVNEDTDV